MRATSTRFTTRRELKIQLTPASLNKYLSLGGDANYNATADGDLEVQDGDLYIAFQEDFSTDIGGAGFVPVPSAVEIMKLRNE